MLELLTFFFGLALVFCVLGATTYMCVTRVQVERTKRMKEVETTKRASMENAWLSQSSQRPSFELPSRQR